MVQPEGAEGEAGDRDDLTHLFEFSPDVLWIMELDPNPGFRLISPSAEAVLGYPREVFYEDMNVWFTMVHRADLGLMGIGQDPDPGLAASPLDEHQVAVRFFRPDAQMRWAEIRWRRVVDDDGVVSLSGVTRDVTEYMASADENARVRQRLTEAETLAEVGSYDWNLVTGDIWFSTNLVRILGHDPATFQPTFEAFLASIASDEERDAVSAQATGLIEAGTNFADEVHIVRPDGASRWLNVVGLFERDEEGQAVRMHGVMRDITEQRHVQVGLQTFIADAAHELRTPVATLIGAISLLQGRIDSLTREQRDDTLALLVRQGHRLQDLSTSLLDLGALEYNVDAVDLRSTPVDAVIADAIDATPPPEHITVETAPSDLVVVCDPWRLQRVLVNLLANAYRYATTMVEVSAIESDGSVVLRVTDDGPGVAPDALDGLFLAFHRSVHDKTMGSGLGLAIVKRLVETMRGSISYRQAVTGGAVFEVRLRKP